MRVRSLERAGRKAALVIGVAAPVALGMAAFGGCSSSPKNSATPQAEAGASSGSEAGATDGSSIFVTTPPDASDGGCDLTGDPKENACVVDEAYGVFVSAGVTGPGTGTMADPFPSIPYALAHLGGKARVFVCKGDYTGPVNVASSVDIYGGFTCTGGTWQWVGGVARVSTTGTDLPLTVQASAGAVRIEDMSFIAPAAVGQNSDGSGVSSIASVVLGGTVLFARDVMIANNGAGGAVGVTGLHEIDGGVQPTNYLPIVTDGGISRAPDGEAGAGFGSILCNFTGDAGVSDRSSGGEGGDLRLTDAGAGGNGTSVPSAIFVPGTTPAKHDGLGGPMSAVAGDPGEDGIARSGGTSASPGSIVSGVWVPAAGGDGLPGQPGQGGGGGAGAFVATLGGVYYVGGGGASGGCGGAGAVGGAGGGGSIALVVAGGAVSLVGCTLTAGNGGNGGNGGAGQDGQQGGMHALTLATASLGGTGGNGAGGSGGAGGAGGVSAGIVYAKGSAPTYTAGDTIIAMGNPGHPGDGGAPGQGPGAPGNPGSMGYAATAAAAIEVESTP